MTTELAYQFEEEPVRVVIIAGNPWFVASDIAKALGYRSANDMTRNLHEDERGTHIVRTPSGDQEMNIVSESGMYAAVFKSRRAEAERFRKWVTSDVLPSIRKTGRYELAGHEPPELEIAPDLDAAKVSAGVALVREARRLFGPNGARDVWMQIGLPQPIVDAIGNVKADELTDRIIGILAGRSETTRMEVARAVGVDAEDFKGLRKVSAAMGLAGWASRTVRRNGVLVKRWFPLSVLEG
jgi:hypothetical protein